MLITERPNKVKKQIDINLESVESISKVLDTQTDVRSSPKVEMPAIARFVDPTAIIRGAKRTPLTAAYDIKSPKALILLAVEVKFESLDPANFNSRYRLIPIEAIAHGIDNALTNENDRNALHEKATSPNNEMQKKTFE